MNSQLHSRLCLVQSRNNLRRSHPSQTTTATNQSQPPKGLLLTSILLKLGIQKSVVKESVLIMPHFDFQLETHYRSGRISCRFVPVSKILKPLLLEHGNVGLIFTKGDLKEVIEEVGKYKVGAPARVGLVAPIDVVVPPGNTGLDPSHKSFFQVLNIPIKINKGIVEIITPVELIRKGDKAGSSEAALLAKVAESVYDDGLVFIPEVLDLTEDMGKFASCVSMVTALSLAIAYPTLAAAPHMFADAYKNVLAIAVGDRLHLPSGRASKRVLEGSEQLWLLPRKRRRNQSLKRSLMPMV
ncbi:unnamed protein product [Linum trigynum]|uniref:Large ribosomal subunit protein uL10-like insertion domain-containing protein n=1 Tax=Linum trigynum TaxID=586398 RepID=A0AAV2FW45_9ROSI